MKEILFGLPLIFAAALILIILAELALRWIARGEPDVNGDPEKDGGRIENLKEVK